MKTFYRFLIFLLSPVGLQANVAQPGIYNAGGNGIFTPAFPQDSAAFQKIQMLREEVYVQVYPGFAVVKGCYWMLNTTDKRVQMNVGYPMNPQKGSDIGFRTVGFQCDSLARLQVRIDGSKHPELRMQPDPDFGQWYVWDMDFAPKDTLLIEVFFIVNTNEAGVRQGYNGKQLNGFVYVLETGATWKQPIRQGWVGLQLMDGLDFDDVDGLWPDSVFQVNAAQRMIVRSFQDLSPKPDDNLVLTYGKVLNGFDFKSVVSRADQLYTAVEAFSKSLPQRLALTERRFDNPFEISGWSWLEWMALLVLAVPVLVVGAMVWFFVRRSRHRSRSNIDPLR